MVGERLHTMSCSAFCGLSSTLLMAASLPAVVWGGLGWAVGGGRLVVELLVGGRLVGGAQVQGRARAQEGWRGNNAALACYGHRAHQRAVRACASPERVQALAGLGVPHAHGGVRGAADHLRACVCVCEVGVGVVGVRVRVGVCACATGVLAGTGGAPKPWCSQALCIA